MLVFKARYHSEILGEENILDVPFNILKKDNPIAVARYIKEYVVEASQRNGVYNKWATKILKQNGRVICQLHWVKEIKRGYRIIMDQKTR